MPWNMNQLYEKSTQEQNNKKSFPKKLLRPISYYSITKTYPQLHTSIKDNWDQAYEDCYGIRIDLKSKMLYHDLQQRLPARFRVISAS